MPCRPPSRRLSSSPPAPRDTEARRDSAAASFVRDSTGRLVLYNAAAIARPMRAVLWQLSEELRRPGGIAVGEMNGFVFHDWTFRAVVARRLLEQRLEVIGRRSAT